MPALRQVPSRRLPPRHGWRGRGQRCSQEHMLLQAVCSVAHCIRQCIGWREHATHVCSMVCMCKVARRTPNLMRATGAPAACTCNLRRSTSCTQGVFNAVYNHMSWSTSCSTCKRHSMKDSHANCTCCNHGLNIQRLASYARAKMWLGWCVQCPCSRVAPSKACTQCPCVVVTQDVGG
eukprot:10661116-Alexandrium_andersonii.AAC.1